MLKNYYFETKFKSKEEIEELDNAIVSINQKLERLVKGERVFYTPEEHAVFNDILSQLQVMIDKDRQCN